MVANISSKDDYSSNASSLAAVNQTQPTTSVLSMGDSWAVVWMAAATLFTTVGNLVICWIICRAPLLLNTHNKFVLSLAWCDLLMGILNGPLAIVAMVYDDWVLGVAMCQINGLLTTLFGVASVITLSVISLNRCYMIAYATKGSQIFTQRRTNGIILGVWLFSMLCAFPPIVGWSRYTFIRNKAICTIQWSTSVSYTVVVIVFGVCLPFVIVVSSYFCIFRKVRQSNRKIGLNLSRTDPATIGFTRPGTRTSSGFDEMRFHQSTSSTAAPATGAKISMTDNSSFAYYYANAKQCERKTTEPGSPVDSLHNMSLVAGTRRSRNFRSSDPFSRTTTTSGPTHQLLSRSKDAADCSPSDTGIASDKIRSSFGQTRRRISRRLSLNISLQTNPEEIQSFKDTKSLCGLKENFQLETSDIRSMSLDSSVVRALAQAPVTGAMETGVQYLSVASLLHRPPATEYEQRLVSGPSTLLRMARMKKRTSALNAAIKTTACPGGCTGTQRHTSTTAKTAHNQSGDVRMNLERSRKMRIAEEVKVSLTLLIVIVIFAISWAPISLVNCLETFQLVRVPRSIDRLAVCMMFLQSAINPILYGVMNKNFRSRFDSILKCCICTKSS